MFSSLGLFSGVSCPHNGQCTVSNFADSKETANAQPGNTDEPIRKRQRLYDDGQPLGGPSIHEVDNIVAARNSTPVAEWSKSSPSRTKGSLDSLGRRVSPPPISRITTRAKAVGPVEEGHVKGTLETSAALQKRQIKKESLNPRHLSKPPATHVIRMSILVKLHSAMVRLNEDMKKSVDTSKKGMILSADELVTMALDEEEKIAKDSRNGKRLSRLFLRPEDPSKIIKREASPQKPLSTGLTAEEEKLVLSTLYASTSDLKELEYVMTPPSMDEVASAKRGIEASQGWEKCDRCNGRFQVFPGRRSDGALTSSGPCVYHYARPIRPPKQKTEHIVGQKEFFYPCCKEAVGTSTGCTRVDSHVFKVTDMKRLAATMQFEQTPRQPEQQALPPVCVDCEMGYTTLGLEMIRLTAITWPEGKVLVDVLVRPIGEILDLNTRYSGIRPEQFAKATPYKAKQKPTTTGNTHDSEPTLNLEMVDSPAAARELLFQHLQPETPLLGHALDNDLNVCRIVHPTIVDTVLLYPHPAGLPMRNGLRALTKKYLGRDIQTGGGTEGHDSIEDTKATGDLVRHKVGEKWKVMKRSGWAIRDGKLVNPAGNEATERPKTPDTSLGLKRKTMDST
ncbi:RNA exonuclease 3 [Nannizzia gypsea CBS 118893]|uniref:RNA exonuclease 3 n=1 Tax=Arthroderma gypseum (strain ATCC MYA-4604 / CBS 118893) TaxID=535722 RepID=E5R3M2_ARTGP|nr:RNA exonuclease 3 [Nannizzia gypsea CBS 118893]EFQ97146.1 RNA exonuclease 3 [Nannizzia gypsea CBS 118893]